MSAVTVELPHRLSEASRNGFALKENRKSLGISREVFAPIGGVSVRSLASYEKEAEIPSSARRAVREGLRLAIALTELAGDKKELKNWLETENQAFDDRTPLQVVSDGDSEMLWEMIYQLRNGAYA